ncbi:MAG: prepilin-type N-terminal cleavage/methylation domain-containing protein [Actinobacteria bacterium]|nr:prepilin-type N-terminal cleavage/methylation domain-containing protein [Actinomycetota bacterium]
MKSNHRNLLMLFCGSRRESGFTIVELMIVIVILGVMTGMAVPVFSDSREMARRNACNYAQRQIESALVQWRFMSNQEFITGNCLPGEGEAYLDLDGNVPGEPDRSLANFVKGKFDCTSNGEGVGQVSGCDYITDGYVVACMTDNSVGTRFDGTPFKHDKPLAVNWKHIIGAGEDVGEPASPLGDTFAEIMDSLKALMNEYYEKYGKWPSNNFEKMCEELGLDPDVLADAINGLYFTPKGKTVEITPGKDYAITVKGVNGKDYTVTDTKGKLIYDAASGKWYYNSVSKKNEVDISTMDIKQS